MCKPLCVINMPCRDVNYKRVSQSHKGALCDDIAYSFVFMTFMFVFVKLDLLCTCPFVHYLVM